MEMKNFFKTAIFAGTLAVGLTAAINFAPNAEAATVDYSWTTMTSKGKSDYGIYNGKVYDIKTFYQDYASPVAIDYQTISGINYTCNKGCDNYRVMGHDESARILLYGDDPITAFVERKCFTTVGDYVLFGDEYGYFVHTVKADDYSLQSVILLIDFSYTKTSSQINTFSAEVVSQTSVITLNYDLVYRDYWRYNKLYNIEVENEEINGTNVLTYQLGKNRRPSDGYLIAPVLSDGWEKGTTRLGIFSSTTIASYKKLYMSDMVYCAHFINSNGSAAETAQFSIGTVAQSLCYTKHVQNSVWQDIANSYGVPVAKDALSAGITYGSFFWRVAMNKVYDVPYLGMILRGIKTTVGGTINFIRARQDYYNEYMGENAITNPLINNPIQSTDRFGYDYVVNDFAVEQCNNKTANLIVGERYYTDKDNNGNDNNGEISDHRERIDFNVTMAAGDTNYYSNLFFFATPLIKNAKYDWLHSFNGVKYEAPDADNITYINNDDGESLCALTVLKSFQNDYYSKNGNRFTNFGNITSFPNINFSNTGVKYYDFSVSSTGDYEFNLSGDINNDYALKIIDIPDTPDTPDTTSYKIVYIGTVNNYSKSFKLNSLAKGNYRLEVVSKKSITNLNSTSSTLMNQIVSLNNEINSLNNRINDLASQNNNSFYAIDMCGTIASSNNPLINSLISQRNTKENNLLEKRKELFKEVVGQKNYGISVTKKTAPVPIYVPTC